MFFICFLIYPYEDISFIRKSDNDIFEIPVEPSHCGLSSVGTVFWTLIWHRSLSSIYIRWITIYMWNTCWTQSLWTFQRKNCIWDFDMTWDRLISIYIRWITIYMWHTCWTQSLWTFQRKNCILDFDMASDRLISAMNPSLLGILFHVLSKIWKNNGSIPRNACVACET